MRRHQTPSSEDETGPRRACEGTRSRDVGPYRPLGSTHDTEEHISYERPGVQAKRPDELRLCTDAVAHISNPARAPSRNGAEPTLRDATSGSGKAAGWDTSSSTQKGI